MIKKLLKWLFFISVVLSIGQIPVGKSTVGARFVSGVQELAQRGWNEVSRSSWFNKIFAKAPEVIEKKISEIPQKFSPKQKVAKVAPSLFGESQDADGPTDEDREEMMRILESHP